MNSLGFTDIDCGIEFVVVVESIWLLLLLLWEILQINFIFEELWLFPLLLLLLLFPQTETKAPPDIVKVEFRNILMMFCEFKETIGIFEEEVTTIDFILSLQAFKKLHNLTPILYE